MKYFFTSFFIFLFSVKFIFAQQPSIVEVDEVKLETPNQQIPIIGSLKSKKISNIMKTIRTPKLNLFFDFNCYSQKHNIYLTKILICRFQIQQSEKQIHLN